MSDTKQKLLIITNLYPTPWDPFRGTFNFQQFNYLAKYMDIKLIVPVSWKDRLLLHNKPTTALEPHPLQGKAVYPLYFYTPGILRSTYGWSLWLSLKLQCHRWIKDFAPDYLLSCWAYPEGVAGTRIATTLGIPAFVKVHGSDVNITGQQPAVKPQIEAWGKKVSAVASVSQDLKNKLVALGVPQSKVHVIYNGIDHQRFHPVPGHQARQALNIDVSPFLLYVGDLKKRKGCLDLLEAFLSLQQSHPDLKLYIAGDGAMREALQQRIRDTQMQDRVFLLGKVRHTTLKYWYNAASLVCLPSYNEGVPNVLLEAMACGTPVVASNVGGIPEVVSEHSGILITPGDTDALKNALDQGLTRAWKHDEIHRYTQKFSWEENIRQMLGMFNSGASH